MTSNIMSFRQALTLACMGSLLHVSTRTAVLAHTERKGMPKPEVQLPTQNRLSRDLNRELQPRRRIMVSRPRASDNTWGDQACWAAVDHEAEIDSSFLSPQPRTPKSPNLSIKIELEAQSSQTWRLQTTDKEQTPRISGSGSSG